VFAGSHSHPEFCCLVCHFRSFGDDLLDGIRVDDLLIVVQEIGSRGEVVTLVAVIMTE